jgi:hypothetical protein
MIALRAIDSGQEARLVVVGSQSLQTPGSVQPGVREHGYALAKLSTLTTALLA